MGPEGEIIWSVAPEGEIIWSVAPEGDYMVCGS